MRSPCSLVSCLCSSVFPGGRGTLLFDCLPFLLAHYYGTLCERCESKRESAGHNLWLARVCTYSGSIMSCFPHPFHFGFRYLHYLDLLTNIYHNIRVESSWSDYYMTFYRLTVFFFFFFVFTLVWPDHYILRFHISSYIHIYIPRGLAWPTLFVMWPSLLTLNCITLGCFRHLKQYMGHSVL